MPDLKISQLPVATTPLAGTELVPIVQSGVTDQTTVGAIMTSTVPSGTANGVLYLNGSKVATSGSALTFDGTNLGVTNGATTLNQTVNGSAVLVTGTTGSAVNNYISLNHSPGGGAYSYTAIQIAGVDIFSAGGNLSSYGGNTVVNSPGSTGGIIFKNYGTEGMRLTSTGLGIGTSSPGAKVHAYDTSNSKVLSQTTTGYAQFQASSSSGDFHIAIDNSTGAGFGAGAYSRLLYSTGVYPMVFFTNATERMRLDSSGNLGLGVTPSASWSGQVAFQIGPYNAISGSASGLGLANNAVFTTLGFGAQYLANGAASFLYQNAGAFAWYTAPSGTAGNAISFTQAMTLDASGKLGLGVTSPAVELQVYSSSVARIHVQNSTSGTSTTDGIQFAISGSDGYLWNFENGFLALGTNNTERARITSTGNVVAGGSVALATNATDGFLYVPTCAGTPTGTPTAITGMAPIVVDTTNNKMYFYSGGAWRDAGP